MSNQDPGSDERPDFGPSGYLPERASRRARKIVLRAPMGMHWIWGAVVLGIGVVLVGVVFLVTAGGPPGAPFVELGPVGTLEDGPLFDVHEGSSDTDLIATTSGRLRIFHIPAERFPVSWCEASRQFEGPGGVWTATGRGRGGATSLSEHPTVIVDDIVYWDPSNTIEGPVPDPLDPGTGCN